MVASAAPAPVHETPSKPLARALEGVQVESPTKPVLKEVVVKANPNVKKDFVRKYVGDLENIKSDADGQSFPLIHTRSPRTYAGISVPLQSLFSKRTTSDLFSSPSSTMRSVYPLARARILREKRPDAIFPYNIRSGKLTSALRPHSGLQRRWI